MKKKLPLTKDSKGNGINRGDWVRFTHYVSTYSFQMFGQVRKVDGAYIYVDTSKHGMYELYPNEITLATKEEVVLNKFEN